MKIEKLAKCDDVIKLINIDKNKKITHITNDYKTAKEDSIFFAIKGENFDGNKFASEVLKRGGTVVTSSESYAHNVLVSGGKNVILTKNARRAMSQFAGNFYENPQEKMRIIMVTGTNGKTSTAYIIREILEYSGIRTGIIGTLETRFEDKTYESSMTTPDPIELFEILHDMNKLGAKVVVMEASAHAIALSKIENITAEIAIFTNLSQDHLDFFGSMENYKNAKKALFENGKVKMAIVNADDAVGREIICEARVPVLSYGIENVSDVFCVFSSEMQKFTNEILKKESSATFAEAGKFVMNYLDEICEISTSLKGKFNIYNLLCAITAVRYLGVDFESIKAGVSRIKNVAGRYQEVENNKGVQIVVDYAHTPDGFYNILREMRCEIDNKNAKNFANNKLITVFGCGGNRDASKRGKMGEIAGKYSDYVIITSDNPRLEDPRDIANDILSGVKNCEKVQVILDREDAISKAISISNIGDSIAILGKGHEEYIDQNGEKRYFSDIETVKKYI